MNINIQESQTSILNSKKLNVIGGINSYDGYYENNYKLGSIKILDNSSNAAFNLSNSNWFPKSLCDLLVFITYLYI